MRGFIPPCVIGKTTESIDKTNGRSTSQTNYNLIVAELDEGIDRGWLWWI